MAWIESHQTLRNHPKLKKAARMLHVQNITMIGALHCLWWWALDYAQDGVLHDLDDYDIADAAGWDGEADSFVEVLVKTGFLERADGDLIIHDWYDYAGKLIERRERNAERMRNARAGHNDKRSKHVQGTQRARVKLPNQTVPNQTIEDPPPPPPTDSEPIELPDKSTPEEEDQTPVKELLANHHKHWVVSPIDAEQYERMINRFSFEEVENAQNVAISRRARTPIPYMLSVLENGPGPPSQNGRKATSEQAEDYSEWPKDGLIIRY